MKIPEIVNNLTYTAYEYNRSKGMTHEALADILPVTDEVIKQYKDAYKSLNGVSNNE